MARQSAGILMFREGEVLEVLLVHPGGPGWAKRDEGAWSIPKGEFAKGEDILATARREFEEELGESVTGDFIQLEPVKQSGGKIVHAFAVEGDLDTATFTSNTFEVEWPPRSGRTKVYPEVDKAEWFDIPTARFKINPAQAAFLDELIQKLG